MDLINKLVHFRVRDVYIPEPGNLLMTLHGDDLLQGRVLDLSHDADSAGSYAVVKVAGIDQRLIVPIDQVLGNAWMPFT